MAVHVPGPDTPSLIAAGAVLHVLNQLARGRGWVALVRAATPERIAVPDVLAVWVAGAGAGGLVSARGGDGVRVWLLGRRMAAPRHGVLAGTLAAESAGETAVGLAFVVAAVTLGVWTMPTPGVPGAVPVLAAAAVLAAALAQPRLRAVARRVGADVVRGVRAAGSPARYARRVLPWQLLSRGLRLGAVACFLAGFGAPVTLATVVLFVVAQSSGRVVPFGPGATAASGALIAAGAPAGAGGALVGCLIAMTVTLTAVGFVTAAVSVLWVVGAPFAGLSRPAPGRAADAPATAVPAPAHPTGAAATARPGGPSG
jgi:hypothetical protein